MGVLWEERNYGATLFLKENMNLRLRHAAAAVVLAGI